MSKISLSIYRLPTPRAARIGAVRMVIDRNQQVYLAGSRVESTAPSGEFLIVTLANGQAYYVKADEYAQARAGLSAETKEMKLLDLEALFDARRDPCAAGCRRAKRNSTALGLLQ